MIYFDYTATTKPSEELLNLHQKINKEYWYNSEGLYLDGVKASGLISKSEQLIIDTLKLTHKKVLFTSGATESNNTAILGISTSYLNSPKHLITSATEHSSVLNTFKFLEKIGFSVTYLKPNSDGIINIDDLNNAITPDTILVSIMWVNNIIGSVNRINDICEIVKKHPRAKLHVDAVQGIGKLPIDFNINDIDLITISGHKIHGLKGTGVLIYNDKLAPKLLNGGHQQNSLRPGTVDVAGCVTIAKAIKMAVASQADIYTKTLPLYNHLISALKNEKNLIIITPKYFSPFIISITFKNIKGETALHILETKGIYVGTGSACNSHAKNAESTLEYMIDDKALLKNNIRISLGEETTLSDVDKLIKEIKEIGNK